MSKKAYIKDDKVYGVSISEYFNVKLSDDVNPSVCPTVSLDHMPVKTMAKLCHEALKVRGRPAMKKLSTEELKKTYNGKISWRVLYSKEGAERHVTQAAMDNDELEAEIQRLRELQTHSESESESEDTENEDAGIDE